jgi:hypothetical protein
LPSSRSASSLMAAMSPDLALFQMGTGNGAQILEVLSGSDLHAQGIAIWLFFERARLFARRVSAFACFPCHYYLQPNLLILLPLFLKCYNITVALASAVWRTDLVAGACRKGAAFNVHTNSGCIGISSVRRPQEVLTND